MAVNIGPRIGIDGEAQYRKELSNIIQQQKTLQSEMNAVTSSFSKNTTAEEKNNAVSKVLAEQVKVQKERVEQLAAMLQKSAEKYGENDTKTLKWKEAVNSATSELNKMERELEESSNSTDNLGDALEGAEKGAFSFGDALKANVLAQAIVDGVKRLASAVKDMAGDFIDTAAAVKAEASQFSQTFGDLSDDATAAIGRVANSSGILDTRLNNLGTQIYAFARASGGSTEESMVLMEKALQATADAAAYYDRSLEDTSESLQSFLKGNYANDAALGLSATETTRNAAAMELFGQKFNDLTEIQKQQTLLQMVLDAQKLSGAMGQAAREADGWENVQGNLNEAWRQFQANVGAPFLESLVPLVQNITAAFQDWQNSVDWGAFSASVSGVFNFLVDNGNLIVSIITGIAAGFVAWNVASMIMTVITAIKGFVTALQAGQTAMQALNITMNANPFVLIATLIAGVVAALITLWNTNENFRNGVIKIWENVKEFISGVVTAIVEFFTVTIPNAFNAVIEFVKTNWQALLLLLVNPFAGAFKLLYDNCEGFRNVVDNMVQRVKDAFSNMLEKVKEIAHNIGDAVKNGIQSAVNFITSLPGKALQWGRDFIQGFVDGIRSMISSVINAVKGIANTVADWLHFSRPEKGPLREYESWMPDMIDGMVSGIKANEYKLSNAVGSMASGVAGASTGTLNATYNMTVNGVAGQDINALSNIIMRKIQSATERKGSIWK